MTEQTQAVRHDWTLTEIKALFDQPFNDLVFQAQTIHRQTFDPNAVSDQLIAEYKNRCMP